MPDPKVYYFIEMVGYDYNGTPTSFSPAELDSSGAFPIYEFRELAFRRMSELSWESAHRNVLAGGLRFWRPSYRVAEFPYKPGENRDASQTSSH